MEDGQNIPFEGSGVAKREKQHKLRVALVGITCALVIVVAVFLLCGGDKVIQRGSVAFNDWRKERSYQPSAEIEELMGQLELTNDGKRIFAAVDPTLETGMGFNEKCTFKDVGGYVLGCYVNDPGKVYIYRVDEEELKGIHEATAAHELLHAVWARMSEQERTELTAEMESFKQANETVLGEELALYEAGNWQDELHSRIGVEFADLPEKLEQHYGKYFQNRKKLVEFYQGYKGTYDGIKVRADEIQAEIDQLKEEISNLKVEIDDNRKNYQERLENYKKAVAEYNECARTRTCYSATEFETKANELNAEGGNINYLRDVTNGKVRDYNAKVELLNQKIEEFNQNALHLQELNDKMNSQVERIEDVK